jgi:hypothetical protein
MLEDKRQNLDVLNISKIDNKIDYDDDEDDDDMLYYVMFVCVYCSVCALNL